MELVYKKMKGEYFILFCVCFPYVLVKTTRTSSSLLLPTITTAFIIRANMLIKNEAILFFIKKYLLCILKDETRVDSGVLLMKWLIFLLLFWGWYHAIGVCKYFWPVLLQQIMYITTGRKTAYILNCRKLRDGNRAFFFRVGESSPFLAYISLYYKVVYEVGCEWHKKDNTWAYHHESYSFSEYARLLYDYDAYRHWMFE